MVPEGGPHIAILPEVFPRLTRIAGGANHCLLIGTARQFLTFSADHLSARRTIH